MAGRRQTYPGPPGDLVRPQAIGGHWRAAGVKHPDPAGRRRGDRSRSSAGGRPRSPTSP